MKTYFSSNFKLGILGGGQLGRMLLRETNKLDIQTHVIDPSIDAPCKAYANHFTQGDLLDFDTVYKFGKSVDVLTFEIESVKIFLIFKIKFFISFWRVCLSFDSDPNFSNTSFFNFPISFNPRLIYVTHLIT